MSSALYEAAGIGLARLKKDGGIEGLGLGTRLEIAVRDHRPAAPRWANSVTTSSVGVLRRAKVKDLLG